MLILTRRAGERNMVGDDIVVEIMEIVGGAEALRGASGGAADETFEPPSSN